MKKSVRLFLTFSVGKEKNVLSFNFSSMVTRSIDSILKMVHVMTKNFTDHRVLRIFSSVTSVSYLLREMAGGGERVFSLQKIANCHVNGVKTVKQHIFQTEPVEAGRSRFRS